MLRLSHLTLQDLYERILKNQKEDAPLHTRDGGIFKMGVDVELDRLMTLNEKGHQFLIELETKERQATGIQKLKVKYNRVYGYYIEITHGNIKNVPAHYQRKQSTVNSERYFTEELKNSLLHLILSHQGKLEYASPVVPKTIEAIALYQADELSAKVNAYKNAIQTEIKGDSKWTKYIQLAGTDLYGQDLIKVEKENRTLFDEEL